MTQPLRCPLCEAEHLNAVLERTVVEGTTYSLHACAHCNAQYWMPFKNPGSGWYEHDERYSGRNKSPIRHANQKQREVLDSLLGKEGRLLDVGCGVGNFLGYAESRGWECWGIDFDRDAIDAGKRVFGLKNLSVSDLATFAAAHPEARFDLITFFDVFEHLDDHRVFTETLRKLLAPGGTIALSVPYRHGWRWLLPHDLPPRHLTRWDEGSLRRFFEPRAFTGLTFRRLPADIGYLVMKLRFRFGRWTSFNMVHKAHERATTASKKPGTDTRRPFSVRVLHALAVMKDAALFGIPAVLLWCTLLPFKTRYTGLWMTATYGSRQ
jgi:SAM-dependent methyltransferase